MDQSAKANSRVFSLPAAKSLRPAQILYTDVLFSDTFGPDDRPDCLTKDTNALTSDRIA